MAKKTHSLQRIYGFAVTHCLMLRRGVLNKYQCLEHGAHYAIGLLAVLMLLSVKTHVPEFITGGVGLLVIAARKQYIQAYFKG